MSAITIGIASQLRAAREAKRLTQRQLSKLIGLPQGHISNIERGAVDLRTSSLVELCRALDLELALVPRKSLPAVQALVQSVEATHRAPALKQWPSFHNRLLELTVVFPDNLELAQLRRLVRDLQGLPLTTEDRKTLNDAYTELVRARRAKDLAPIRAALDQLQTLRAEIAHRLPRESAINQVRPAYSLEDESDG